MQDAFRSKLSKLKNIKTTDDLVKPMPIDEILKNLDITVSIQPLTDHGYLDKKNICN